MPSWFWWTIWGTLGVGAIFTYAVIGSSLNRKNARLAKRLSKVTEAAAKLAEAARLLDRNK